MEYRGFYTECTGFSATVWLSTQISKSEALYCYHGTRTVPEKSKLGSPGDLMPEGFCKALNQLSAESYKFIGATHALYDSVTMLNACRKHEIPYSLIFRHPFARVKSCFNYLMKRRSQDIRATNTLELRSKGRQIFGQDFSDIDALFQIALQRIIRNDHGSFELAGQSDVTYVRMEDFTCDKQAFEEALCRITKCDQKFIEEQFQDIELDSGLNQHSKDKNVMRDIYLQDLKYNREIVDRFFTINNMMVKEYKKLGYDILKDFESIDEYPFF